ncbi:hypothetical protein LTR27_005505 [Elasticomyces elasticus]|nr:hypothetical protein LTR27_005505 [Elasticomyces elasticus]
MSTPTQPWDWRKDLLIINPKLRDTREEPCTTTMAVIMALLAHDHPLTRAEICEWMVDVFGYYRRLAFLALWIHDKPSGKTPMLKDLHRELDDVYRTYDSPVRLTEGPRRPHEDVTFTVLDSLREQWLGPEPPVDYTNFPFFELPPELRTVIYEMVFEYPKSGLYFASAYHDRPKVRSQNPNDNGDFEGLQPINVRWLPQTKPIKSILRPLLISRDFYAEARPVFFDTNKFCFADLATMSRLIMRMPVSHVQSLRSAEVFSELSGLRRLTIRFDEEYYLSRVPVEHREELADMAFVVGLSRLRGLNEATFIGCPNVEGLVRENMLRKAD